MRLGNIARRITVLVLTLVMVTLMVGFNLEVASGKGKFEATNAKKFKLKGWANMSGALLEWTKVDGAKSYTVYRAWKKKNKKGKEKSKYTKYKKIKKVKESYFYCKGKDNSEHRRWYVNMFGGKKGIYTKHSCKYIIKSNNGYKSNIFSFKKKKYKAKVKNDNYIETYILAYPEFYYVNKERKDNGLPLLMWCHSAEKGILKRAKEVKITEDHTRPNGKSCFSIWKEKAFQLSKYIDATGENLAEGDAPYSKKHAKALVKRYMKSKGHKENILFSSNYDGFFVSGTGTVLCYNAYSVDCFFKSTEALYKEKEAIRKKKEEEKAKSETLSTQNDIQFKKAEAAELFAPMLLPDFASQYKDRNVDELFNEFKNNGWLNNAISKLGEAKVYELFKEFVNNDLANESKTKEYDEWLLKIVTLIS